MRKLWRLFRTKLLRKNPVWLVSAPVYKAWSILTLSSMGSSTLSFPMSVTCVVSVIHMMHQSSSNLIGILTDDLQVTQASKITRNRYFSVSRICMQSRMRFSDPLCFSDSHQKTPQHTPFEHTGSAELQVSLECIQYKQTKASSFNEQNVSVCQ